MNFCEFIRKIAEDPAAKVTKLTVGDWMDLRDHAYSCEACMEIVERVAAEAPPETTSDLFGEN